MIGYYVHHQGAGHLTRATAIAHELEGEEPVTGLSSLPRPAAWTGPWVQLERDDDPAAISQADVTASGALHWAPAGHDGLRERMGQIAAWIMEARPRLVVIDVSVEVCVLVRAMGVPVVVVGLPGARDDAPHQLAYRMAAAILAPWPAWAHVLTGGESWMEKTHAVGAISRFDRRAHAYAAAPRPDRRRRVLVLSGRGGTQLTVAALAAAQLATPDWAWTVLGPPGDRWIEDPWELLCDADVVVTHAGQNAIADVAAARRPAVVIPQGRPYGEQRATARALGRAGLAIEASEWSAAPGWSALLSDAANLGGAGWTRWSSGHGARRAADAIRQVRDAASRPPERVCALR
jgi:hypothetical protein